MEANDLLDILARWNNPEAEAARKRTDASFLVPVAEIEENDWDLSINRYKEIEYEEVVYDPSVQIIADIRKLQRKNQE